MANHKRVRQLHSEAKLAVRRRKKVKRPASERLTHSQVSRPNEVWSMDFVMDGLANARPLKCLTVADDFTHESIKQQHNRSQQLRNR